MIKKNQNRPSPTFVVILDSDLTSNNLVYSFEVILHVLGTEHQTQIWCTKLNIK